MLTVSVKSHLKRCVIFVLKNRWHITPCRRFSFLTPRNWCVFLSTECSRNLPHSGILQKTLSCIVIQKFIDIIPARHKFVALFENLIAYISFIIFFLVMVFDVIGRIKNWFTLSDGGNLFLSYTKKCCMLVMAFLFKSNMASVRRKKSYGNAW